MAGLVFGRMGAGMQESDNRFPKAQTARARFTGSVAVMADPWVGLRSTLTRESVDDQPWAVQIGYTDAHGPAVTVRTVRLPHGVTERAKPVEDLGLAVVNFRNELDLVHPRRSDQPWPGRFGTEEWVAGQRAAAAATRREVAATPTTTVTIPAADSEAVGEQVVLADCTALELSLGGQAVFCVGRHDVVSRLRLQIVAPQDLEDALGEDDAGVR